MRTKGLTLVEVLVSLVVIGVIAAAVTSALLGGFYLLKQAEYKARAMGVASAKIGGLLSKSYSTLKEGEDQDQWVFPKDTSAVDFFWASDVQEDEIGDMGIPYKNITVNCTYIEKSIKGAQGKTKEVRLTNLLAYPQVHSMPNRALFGQRSYSNPELSTARLISRTVTVPHGAGENAAQDIDSAMNTQINYRTRKDLQVYYNIAIKSHDVKDELATVFTSCYLDGVKRGVTTRTPIISQPFLSNSVVFDNIAPGSHEVTFKWYWTGDDNGNKAKVTLREFDLCVLAYEDYDD